MPLTSANRFYNLGRVAISYSLREKCPNTELFLVRSPCFRILGLNTENTVQK